MSAHNPSQSSDEMSADIEKTAATAREVKNPALESPAPAEPISTSQLHKKLKSRHVQLIAIGGSIGAGLFVGSGYALHAGGPGNLLLGFLVIGAMLLCTMQGLGEMAILYPVNGGFFEYICRFVDDSLGMATGLQYAIGWCTVLPFELTAASITAQFWGNPHSSYVVAPILVFLAIVHLIGVKGFGEVEVVLSSIKIAAILGFVIFAIVVDVGGVSTDSRGYIGARYWHDPGAFQNGIKGFISVFSVAGFAYGGTELVGLTAVETPEPHKSLPKAIRQVFWRIATFYLLGLFMLGLILPSDDVQLLGSTGANTKASPFVLATKLAGVKALPHIFNAVILCSVISVSNSSLFASTRTMQALADKGMAPKLLKHIDKKGRPIYCLILQLLVGCVAFISELDVSKVLFDWLLALTSLSFFFIWLSINLAHIRFRAAWSYAGFTVHQLPYRAAFGTWGSYFGVLINILALVANFYVALFPLGHDPSPKGFFKAYLAGPVLVVFYLFWKVKTRNWRLFVRVEDMDVRTGMSEGIVEVEGNAEKRRGWRRVVEAVF